MTNLLEETKEDVKGRKVDWVGTKDGKYRSPWDDFQAIAKDIEYDSGYGSHEISQRLIVVGDGWWLERHEYDGSEWWESKKMPVAEIINGPLTEKIIKDTDWE